MLDKKKKEQIIKKFRTHEGDTGSSEVQIAILTEEIKDLTEHLKLHKKDFSSRRGLIKKVIQRKRLLRYLEKENFDSFQNIIKRLRIKISPLKVREDLNLEKKSENSEEEVVDEDTQKEEKKK